MAARTTCSCRRSDKDILAKSDVVLSLDWPDLQECMIQARGAEVGA